jgi:polar amino acid transport system permease protein
MTATDERRKSIDFSDPYVTTGLAMLVPIDSEIKGGEDLRKEGRKIVVKLGTTGEAYARKELKDAEILTMQHDPACALEVSQNKVDAWIYDQLSIFKHHKNHIETTRAILTPLRKEQWAIGLRKPKSGEVNSLENKVNTFIKNFRESGEFDKLAEVYLKEEKELVNKLGIPFIFDLEQSVEEEKDQIETDLAFKADLPFLCILFFLLSVCLISFYFLVRENRSLSTSYSKSSFELLSFVVLWMVLIGSTYFIFSSLNQTYTWNWEGIWSRRWQIFGGWIRTIWVSLLALVLCVFLAVSLVVGSKSRFKAVRFFCRSYTEIIRGSPLLVILIVGYYVIAEAVDVNNRLLVGVVLLAVFSGAYLSEIIRGGIDSVGKTQFDAARAVGFSTFQAYRYVIIPQAVRRVLPAVAGLFIMLVKDSSLLSVIGAEEFTKRTEIARAATFTGLEAFIPLAVGYLLITIPLALVSRYLERRLNYES